jgi:hypothetical protein
MDHSSLTRTFHGVCPLQCKCVHVQRNRSTSPNSEYIDGTCRFPSCRNPAVTIQSSASFLTSSEFNLIFLKRWLLEVGRDEEAREVVYKLHGYDRSSADKEFTEMHDVIKAELFIRSRKLSDLWATRAMQRRTLVAVGVQVFTQFTGINGTRMIAQCPTAIHLSFY